MVCVRGMLWENWLDRVWAELPALRVIPCLADNCDHTWQSGPGSLTWCRPRGYNDNVPVVAPCTGGQMVTLITDDDEEVERCDILLQLLYLLLSPSSWGTWQYVHHDSDSATSRVESIAVNNDGLTPGHLWLQSIGGQWREINNLILNSTAFILQESWGGYQGYLADLLFIHYDWSCKLCDTIGHILSSPLLAISTMPSAPNTREQY